MAWTGSSYSQGRFAPTGAPAAEARQINKWLQNMRISPRFSPPRLALALNVATASLLVAQALAAPLAVVLATAGGVFFLTLHVLHQPRPAARSDLANNNRPGTPPTLAERPDLHARYTSHAWSSKTPPSENAALMARVSHELRTPLNAVIGFSDLMSRELLGPLGNPRYQEYACHVRDCGRDLLKSAEDTLAMTALMSERLRSSDLTAIEMAPFVADAWTFYAADAAHRGIALRLDIEHGLEVLAERRTLRQILINLIADALAAARSASAVTVRAVADRDLVEIQVVVETDGERRPAEGGSLPLCLAKAMLELQGTSLLEIDPGHSRRIVATVLDRAVQRDLFACA